MTKRGHEPASTPLPHEQVHVRLGKSKIHGIGVFASRPIAAGTNVFATDRRELRWVPASLLNDPTLDKSERSFYEDFGIRRGSELGCPSDFNHLTVGWYVNEPPAGSEPNLIPTPDYDLIAHRDIEAGEELTVRYAAFKEVSDLA